MFVDGNVEGELTPLGQIIVGVNADTLTVGTTLAAILDLINEINRQNGKTDVISVDFIKDLSINLKASRLNGLNIDVAAELVPKVELVGGKPKVDATGKTIYKYESGLKLHFETGTENKPLQIGNLGKLKIDLSKKADAFAKYEDDLIQALVSTVGKAKFTAKVNFKTFNEKFDLTSIINNILSANGKEINLPINLHLDDWDTEVDLVVAWKLDLENFRNSQLQVKFSYGKKTLLEVDILQGSLVVDLTGLGFFKLELVNSPFVELINNALKGVVKKLGNFNLSELLDKVIGNTNPGEQTSNNVIANASFADSTPNENPPAGDNKPSAGLDQNTLDLIAIVINGIKANNATLFVKLDALMMDQIFSKLLGFGLGIGIGVDAKFDVVNGEMDISLGVESMSIDINFKMVVGADAEIDLVAEGVDLNAIPDWDATNGATLTKSLLDNLDIALAVDYKLTNRDNAAFRKNFGDDSSVEDYDESNNEPAGTYYTRIIVEKLKNNKTLANTGGKKASKGSILVTVASINKTKYNNSEKLDGDNFSPMVYAELNYNEGKLNVALAKGLIKLGSIVDFADVINISTPLDIINLLGPTLDKMLEDIRSLNKDYVKPENPDETNPNPDGGDGGTTGGDSGTTTPEEPKEPSRMDKAFANLDIMQLLGGGIDVYLRNTGLFNVNVTFDPFTINWVIDEVVSSLFGPDTILNLAEITKTYDENGNVTSQMLHDNYLAKVNWDRIDAEHFWFSLQDQLKPLAKDAVRSLGYGAAAPLITDAILNGFYKQIRRVVTRLLPFPVFNDFQAGINVMDGTFANVYIQGYDKNQNVYLPQGKTIYLWNPSTKQHEKKVVGENEWTIYTYKQITGRTSGGSDDVLGGGAFYSRQYAASNEPNVDQGTYRWYGRSRSAKYHTEIWLYNCSPGVGKPTNPYDTTDGVMTWGEIDAAPKFDPYSYSSTITDGLYQTTNEAKSAFLAKEFSNKEVKYQKGTTLLKTTPTYSCIAKVDKDGKVIDTNGYPKSLDAINFNDPGIYQIEAKAQFSGGIVRTYTIYMTIYGFDTITGIGEYDLNKSFVNEIQLHAYSSLPKMVVIKYDVPDVRGETTRRIPVTDSMFSDYAPQGVHDHTITTAKIKLPGSQIRQFNLHYLDSKVEEVRGGKYIPIDLYQFTATLEEQLSVYAPELLYFQYPNGASDKIKVNGKWDMTEARALVEKQDLKGIVYKITNTIGSSTTLQDVSIYFVVKSREVDNIEINGQQNIVRISPYQYYLYNVSDQIKDAEGNLPAAKDETLNPFPTTVKATYTATLNAEGNPIAGLGRYTEDVLVRPWKFEGTLTWDNNNKIQKDAQGNPVKNTTLTLDTISTIPNKPGETGEEKRVYDTKFTWDYKLNVTLDRNEVQEIYFDEELKNNVFSIDPYQYSIYGDKIFPKQAWVKFINGSVMKMPIAWVKEELETFGRAFGFEEQTRQFRAYIGYDLKSYPDGVIPQADVFAEGGKLANADYAKAANIDGKFLQRIVVNARVEGLVADGIDMKGSTLNPNTVFAVDPVINKYLKDSEGKARSPFPSQVKVVYKNNAGSAILPVTWTYDENAINNINGVENMVATATIQGTNISFDINCRVLGRTNPIVIDNTRTINPYDCDYDESGNRVYREFTKTLSVKYFTSYALKVTEIETKKEFEITDLFTEAMRDEARAFYTTGDNAGKYNVENLEDIYATYDIPVEWNTREISYKAPLREGKDVTINAFATFVGATTEVETIAIPCTILYKKIVSIDEDPNYTIYVVQDGANLSDAERASKKIEREVYVTFTDGRKLSDGSWDPQGLEAVKIKVTFDLNHVDFSTPAYNIETSEPLAGYSPTQATAYILKNSDIEQTITINVYVTTKPTADTDTPAGN